MVILHRWEVLLRDNIGSMEKQRLFDDSRVKGIMNEINWNRLFTEVYSRCHSISIDESNLLELFMIAGILEIEVWHWANGWVTCSKRRIRVDGYFRDNLESAIKNCLIEAKF